MLALAWAALGEQEVGRRPLHPVGGEVELVRHNQSWPGGRHEKGAAPYCSAGPRGVVVTSRQCQVALDGSLIPGKRLFNRHGETSIVQIQPAFARGSTALFRGAVGCRELQGPQLHHAEQQMSDLVISEPGKMHNSLTVVRPPVSLLGSGSPSRFDDPHLCHCRFSNDVLVILVHLRKSGQSGTAPLFEFVASGAGAFSLGTNEPAPTTTVVGLPGDAGVLAGARKALGCCRGVESIPASNAAAHFPIQKLEKMCASRSSVANAPVISPSASCAARSSSATSSPAWATTRRHCARSRAASVRSSAST